MNLPIQGCTFALIKILNQHDIGERVVLFEADLFSHSKQEQNAHVGRDRDVRTEK